MADTQVVVATFGQPIDARVLQSTLESAGVSTFLDGEYTVGNDPLISIAIGGVRLKVSSDQLEQARPIVEQYLQSDQEARERRVRTCPECGVEDGISLEPPLWISIVSILTLRLISSLQARYRCRACGNRWC